MGFVLCLRLDGEKRQGDAKRRRRDKLVHLIATESDPSPGARQWERQRSPGENQRKIKGLISHKCASLPNFQLTIFLRFKARGLPADADH